MKKALILASILIISSAHDMFIKMDSYFLKPNKQAELFIFNGTFEKSENTIERKRMRDVTILGPDYRIKPEEISWYEENNITCLRFNTGKSGAYVAGISIVPNMIELSANEFNEYLKHDGVLNVLEDRRKSQELNLPAKEKYSKHVKAIFQVGEKTSGNFAEILGYPIEFVPMENPYTLNENEILRVKLLKNGKPLRNHLVYVGFMQAGHDYNSREDHHHAEMKLETNTDGIASLLISQHGHWYIRTIHMVRSNETGVDYESNWATLTFEIRY